MRRSSGCWHVHAHVQQHRDAVLCLSECDLFVTPAQHRVLGLCQRRLCRSSRHPWLQPGSCHRAIRRWVMPPTFCRLVVLFVCVMCVTVLQRSSRTDCKQRRVCGRPSTKETNTVAVHESVGSSSVQKEPAATHSKHAGSHHAVRVITDMKGLGPTAHRELTLHKNNTSGRRTHTENRRQHSQRCVCQIIAAHPRTHSRAADSCKMTCVQITILLILQYSATVILVLLLLQRSCQSSTSA